MSNKAKLSSFNNTTFYAKPLLDDRDFCSSPEIPGSLPEYVKTATENEINI